MQQSKFLKDFILLRQKLIYIYIYIYSLYIKRPGLPIIKEAQASQYAHWVEPHLVSPSQSRRRYPVSPISPAHVSTVSRCP
jgi:hypothetical protein